MKTKDIKPGMEVAVKILHRVERGFVIGTGWIRLHGTHKQSLSATKIAVALPGWGLGPKEEREWQPELVLPNAILGPWDAYLAQQVVEREAQDKAYAARIAREEESAREMEAFGKRVKALLGADAYLMSAGLSDNVAISRRFFDKLLALAEKT